MIKHVFASAALFALIAGPACAADLSVKPIYKAPAAVVAPVPFSWTGFYVGGNAGYAWGKSHVQMLSGSPTPADAAAENAAATVDFRDNAFVGGGQVGYNWQSGPIVLGLEADFNSLRLRASQGGTFPFAAGVAPGTFTVNQSLHTNWLFTGRPRLGFAADNVLIYATGGIAVTDLHYAIIFIDNNPGGAASENASLSKTKVGWTAGGGFELALANNWSVKAEYLHAEFGAETTSGANNVGEVNVHNLSRLKVDLVRGGLNYRFAWGKAPIVARY
jgi:outer membrane immunogenic protein